MSDGPTRESATPNTPGVVHHTGNVTTSPEVVLATECWSPPAGTPSRGAVILLHGGGQTRHSWKHTGTRLAGAAWSATTYDARGHGDSSRSPQADYSAETLAADLSVLARRLPHPRVAVGASMGGITALTAQADVPGLFDALVLVDIVHATEASGAEEIRSFMRSGTNGFESLEAAAAAVAAYSKDRRREPNIDGLRKNLRQRDGRWYWHWDPAVLDGFSAGSGPEAGRGLTEHMVHAAEACDIPVLLLRGSQSRVTTSDAVEEFAALLRHARIQEVSGTGHMIAGDDNDVFMAHLAAFLDQLASAP